MGSRGSGSGGIGKGGSVVINYGNGVTAEYRTRSDGKVYNYNTMQVMPGNTSLKELAQRATANGYSVQAYNSRQTKQRDDKRSEERRNRPDYELGYGLGPGGSIDRGARRTARRSRLTTRVATRKR